MNESMNMTPKIRSNKEFFNIQVLLYPQLNPISSSSSLDQPATLVQ